MKNQLTYGKVQVMKVATYSEYFDTNLVGRSKWNEKSARISESPSYGSYELVHVF